MPGSVSDAHLEESGLLRLVVGDLPSAERGAAERHLWTCTACREAFRASERLDAALRAAGPALSGSGDEAMGLPATDPFARRPEARLLSPTAGAGTWSLAEATARAVPEARELASRLIAAFEDDDARQAALAVLDLEAIGDRLALAYALDGAFESVEQDAMRQGRSAAAALDRISTEVRRSAGGDAERSMPLFDIRGRALLLLGAANLFGGEFAEAEARLQGAWQAFGEGRASKPLLARAEVLEALRRVAEGRWAEAETLSSRAGETFALTGSGTDAARAALVSGLAAWGDGRNPEALALLRKAALGFRRAEAWGGFSTAGCAAALCMAAAGRVSESRRAFLDLRRRKTRGAPLPEQMFVRETERVALLLVPLFRFSACDVLLLRAASALADGIVHAARESDEGLAAALSSLEGNPARAFALLYACQKAPPLVAADPKAAFELSRMVSAEATTLLDANLEMRTATPAPRQKVQAEAALLESQALLQMGYAKEAREAAAQARGLFDESRDIGFGRALCDYFEGSAATFLRDFAVGERQLKRALRIFAEFGQDHLVGRAEAALGTLLGYRGDYARAEQTLDRAIPNLDPVRDAGALANVLNNRAVALTRQRRYDAARASYARALNLARRNDFASLIGYIRNGLAELDFYRGQFARALRSFGEIAKETIQAGGSPDHVLFPRLFVAECLGRLGRAEEMAAEISSIRRARQTTPFGPSPALEDLFSCLDEGSLHADAVGHVRRFLEEQEKGSEPVYKPLRQVG